MKKVARQIAREHCAIVSKFGPLSIQAKAASVAIGCEGDDAAVLDRLRVIGCSEKDRADIIDANPAYPMFAAK